ncbi:hypothetical protein Dda_3948 [Drechslerella dactyloides]|uniref:Uncharacterized protein n=1 Tax=Drechslerella dactyloides TaxID=74499 RepID=A0AAD6NK00_DREDA|nr:hypothetical protein Dda_3948 [Drechslerella dactyloides]
MLAFLSPFGATASEPRKTAPAVNSRTVKSKLSQKYDGKRYADTPSTSSIYLGFSSPFLQIGTTGNKWPLF